MSTLARRLDRAEAAARTDFERRWRFAHDTLLRALTKEHARLVVEWFDNKPPPDAPRCRYGHVSPHFCDACIDRVNPPALIKAMWRMAVAHVTTGAPWRCLPRWPRSTSTIRMPCRRGPARGAATCCRYGRRSAPTARIGTSRPTRGGAPCVAGTRAAILPGRIQDERLRVRPITAGPPGEATGAGRVCHGGQDAPRSPGRRRRLRRGPRVREP
jgi:hypothetical protein